MEQHEQSLPVFQQTPEEEKIRKRGAPLGNTNALKHGLYVHHKHIRNTNPHEKAALYDLTDHIRSLKAYLLHLYELAARSTDLEAVKGTLRSLSLGCIALTRLIAVHETNSSLPLPDDLLDINYYDEDYHPDEYKDPTFAEIEAKLMELGA
jgi:hypothetical protein